MISAGNVSVSGASVGTVELSSASLGATEIWRKSSVPRTHFAKADWLWEPIPANPVLHPKSSTWAALLAQTGKDRVMGLHEYATALAEPSQIDASTPRYDIAIRGTWGDPFPANVPVRDGQKVPPGTDGHYSAGDSQSNSVFSLWVAEPKVDPRSALYGGYALLDGDGREIMGSSTATLLSNFGGVVRAAELTSAAAEGRGIGRALFFATDVSNLDFMYPAKKSDGTNDGLAADPIPQGVRFQLDPSIDLSAIPDITPAELAIGRTLQTHGMYLTDKGGARISIGGEFQADGVLGGTAGAAWASLGWTGDYPLLNKLPWGSLRALSNYTGLPNLWRQPPVTVADGATTTRTTPLATPATAGSTLLTMITARQGGFGTLTPPPGFHVFGGYDQWSVSGRIAAMRAQGGETRVTWASSGAAISAAVTAELNLGSVNLTGATFYSHPNPADDVDKSGVQTLPMGVAPSDGWIVAATSVDIGLFRPWVSPWVTSMTEVGLWGGTPHTYDEAAGGLGFPDWPGAALAVKKVKAGEALEVQVLWQNRTDQMFLIAAFVPMADGGGEPAPTFSRTVDSVVYDHYGAPLRTDGQHAGMGKHEGVLGGVNTSFDWTHGAKITVAGPYPAGSYTHHNVWGQLCVEGPSTPERRVRLQVIVDGVWHLVNGVWTQRKTTGQMGNFEGGYYRGSDFISTMAMTTSHFRAEASGGHSVDLLPVTNSDGTPHAQQTFAHWFYSGMYPRQELVSGTTAVAVVSRMRLISDVAGVDPDVAKFLACIGGDLYGGATDSGGVANAGFSIPRHKFVIGSQWKSYTDVTGTEAQIRGYPTMPFLA